MSNRQISIRIGMEGDADVRRGIDEITRAGQDGFDRMAASWGKTGEAAEHYKAQLAGVAAAAREAANADEVNRSWSAFLGINSQVTNSAREAASAFQVAKTETTDWGTALSTATRFAGTFGIALSAAGAVEFIRSTAESVAQLDNQAKTLGITTDALQAYHAGAVLSGAGADVGDAAIRRFTRSLGDAEAGTQLQVEAFAALGFMRDDLVGGTEGMLPKVAAALLDISDASTRARIETELFGRAGQDVEILLEKLADPELIAKMKALGDVVGEEWVKRAAEAEKAWGSLWLKISTFTKEAVLGKYALNPFAAAAPPPDPAAQNIADLTAAGSGLAASAKGASVYDAAFQSVPDHVDVTPMVRELQDAIETWQALEQFHKDAGEVTNRADQAAAEYEGRLRDILDLSRQRNEVDAEWQTKFLDKLLDNAKRETSQDLLKGVTAASREQLAPDIEAARAAAESARAFNQFFRPMEREFDRFLLDVETSGKLSFGKLFGSILVGWEEMLNKMISQQLFQSLFGGAASSGLGGLFGSIFGAGGPVVDYHSGGIVGEGTPKRSMPWSTFSTAPRYHMGIDEVPAVLLKGERVLDRQAARAYNSSSSPSKVEMTVNVNVSGARGSQEIADAVNQGVTTAINAYDSNLDRRVLPVITRKLKDPRFGG